MNALIAYVRGSVEELHQVRWPTRRQAVRFSMVVIVVCIVTAALFGVIDYGLAEGVRRLLNTVI